MKMKNTKIYGLVCLLTALLSCNSSDYRSPEDTALEVQVSEVILTQAAQHHHFTAKVRPVQRANLSTKIMGQIAEVYVEEGEKVREGSMMLKINSDDLEAKLATVKAHLKEAKANLENAETQFERVRILHQRKSATQKEYDDSKTQFQSAKARVEGQHQSGNEILELLEYAVLRAPFDGIVVGKFVQKGDLASPGLPMIQIESDQYLEVVAKIPEKDISLFTNTDTVQISVGALNKVFSGQVTKINPSASNKHGQFEVTFSLPISPEVKSGMYAIVTLKKGTDKRIYIPQKALVWRGQLSGVYTVSSQQQALLRWIRLGDREQNEIEVLSGLSPGDKYIIDPKDDSLYDGKRIKVIN